ncbi:MAG: dihydroorotate dehydrogenase electron transfer subunit [Clostridiales Family XIII bacterium]|jgi:dihydroorotate dehydrogenase electron transfer subunit|nr:dihydroorotate dehydrogenase electron transfer subunit [Clostridiales Family XIII bacterium]
MSLGVSGADARDLSRRERGVFRAEILRSEAIATDVHRMVLGIEDDGGPRFPAPLPGRFVKVYLNDASRLLPRPISVCDWSEGRLTLVFGAVGAGTRQLASYARGTALRVGPPAGNGFDTDAVRGMSRVTLVCGGLGAAPLLLLARSLRAAGAPPARAVLGYGSETFLTSEFETHCDALHIATDDGTTGFHGNAAELLKTLPLAGGEYFFACGPAPMLRALSRFAGGQGIGLQVSLEERMGCGYGACLGCVVRIAGADGVFTSRRLCLDGPVFDGSEVIWDV